MRAVGSGGTSAAVSYTWTIDTTPPTVVSINRAGASLTNAASVSWTVTFSEPVAGVAANGSNFSLVASGLTGTPAITGVTGSGASYTSTASTGTGTSGASGSLLARLLSAGSIKDLAGNALTGSLPFNGQSYVIDKTAPAVPTITGGPFQYPPVGWASTSASFKFSDSSSDLSGYLCKLDAGAFSACPNPQSYTGLAQGVHSFQVEASDAAGNVSAPSGVWQFFVDTVPPTKPVFSQTPPDPNTVATSTFAWSSTDPAPGSGVAVYLCSVENGPFLPWVAKNGGPTQPCSSPLTYNVPTTNNGQHQFAVEAVDWAGNISQVASYSWKVAAGSIQNFTIDGNAAGLLYPGVATATPIAVTFHNPNSIPIYVTSLSTALHTADFPVGCSSSAFTITQAVIPSAGVQVPAGGQVTLPAQGATAPTVQMSDSGNQDLCKNLSFHFDYTGSAHS